MDDLLIWCYRKLGPVARRLRIQKVSRRLYTAIAERWYPAGALVTARQNGRTWKLRRDVAERGELQEAGTISWLRKVIRPGMTVIDVGANIGQMTMEAAVLVGPRGRVIAIEPAAGNLEYLRQHVEANQLSDRVTIVDAACTNQDGGDVALYLAIRKGETSSVGSGHGISGPEPIIRQDSSLRVQEVRVPRVSIDGLCQRHGIEPSVIKIDVEGAEILVVQGAKNTLRRARPQVQVGFHPFAFADPRRASAELQALAEQAGYRIEGVEVGDTLKLEEYTWLPC